MPVMSYFRQVYVFLVIETIGQSKPEGACVFFSEVLGLQCIMDDSSNEDHCISLLSFVNRFLGYGCLDYGSNILCSQMELHVLNPLQIVSSRDF